MTNHKKFLDAENQAEVAALLLQAVKPSRRLALIGTIMMIPAFAMLKVAPDPVQGSVIVGAFGVFLLVLSISQFMSIPFGGLKAVPHLKPFPEVHRLFVELIVLSSVGVIAALIILAAAALRVSIAS